MNKKEPYQRNQKLKQANIILACGLVAGVIAMGVYGIILKNVDYVFFMYAISNGILLLTGFHVEKNTNGLY